uniref:Uncharacterized protein n=1 Tax=Haptolina brevifila TaxID=156173 RepID=A0A7S2NQM2_9EUKA
MVLSCASNCTLLIWTCLISGGGIIWLWARGPVKKMPLAPAAARAAGDAHASNGELRVPGCAPSSNSSCLSSTLSSALSESAGCELWAADLRNAEACCICCKR